MGVVEILRRKVGDERLMLHISGSALGVPPTVLLSSRAWSEYQALPETARAVYPLWYAYALLAWSAVLISLLYYAKKIGAVTLIFAALMPWFTFLFLLTYPIYPFEPAILWWTYVTLSSMVPLAAIEYLIKLFLRSIDLRLVGKLKR